MLGRSDLQLSRLFKVSHSTIGRWIRGASASHPLLRKAIVDALLIEVHLDPEGPRTC